MAKKQEEFNIKDYVFCHYNSSKDIRIYAKRSSEHFVEVAYVMNNELLYKDLFSKQVLDEMYDIYTGVILNKKK